MTVARHLALLGFFSLLAAAPAAAQPASPQPAPQQPAPPPPAPAAPPPAVSVEAPPGLFAVDARFAMPSFNTGSAVADPLGLRTAQLPSRGWGYDVGVQVYPVRGKRIALGFGASIVRASGSKAPDPEDPAAVNDPTIETRVSLFVPQVSLNFGSGRGWSYISGGYASSQRATGDVDADVALGPRKWGLHYGGGAKWFFKSHVAFAFDLRFYSLPAQEAEGTTVPFQPKTRMFLGSVGLAFK
jgi:hypothetical protein